LDRCALVAGMKHHWSCCSPWGVRTPITRGSDIWQAGHCIKGTSRILETSLVQINVACQPAHFLRLSKPSHTLNDIFRLSSYRPMLRWLLRSFPSADHETIAEVTAPRLQPVHAHPGHSVLSGHDPDRPRPKQAPSRHICSLVSL